MQGTIRAVPHPDTEVTIELKLTFKEAQDLLLATTKTQHYPMGKLQNILLIAVKEVYERLNLNKVTDGN